ncbi:MAG: hypothetical protein AB1Z55_00205 [Acidimicrobiia bacterium]
MAEAIPRTDWDRVSSTFAAFFAGVGEVAVGPEEVSMTADETGIALARDGTSRSFMPLHELGLRWETVVFDEDADAMVLAADGATYTYRVPPSLR